MFYRFNCRLVSIFGRVVLGGHNQTPALSGSPVDRLYDINHLLLVLHGPVDLVVVSGAQINHDVLVPKEEHASARVIQLVHLVEVGDLGYVDQIDDAKVLALFGDSEEGFIHFHAGGVPVMAEPDEHDLVLFRQDGLVYLPAIREMS
jgi:hypothetical protein